MLLGFFVGKEYVRADEVLMRNMGIKKIVGQRLQLLRIERNLIQEQMGEKLSLSTSACCKIEYGETGLTLTRLDKIAEILEMSPLDLFNKIKKIRLAGLLIGFFEL